jgi:hypothetical protein
MLAVTRFSLSDDYKSRGVITNVEISELGAAVPFRSRAQGDGCGLLGQRRGHFLCPTFPPLALPALTRGRRGALDFPLELTAAAIVRVLDAAAGNDLLGAHEEIVSAARTQRLSHRHEHSIVTSGSAGRAREEGGIINHWSSAVNR